tara:strand:+ start:1704 stop:1853 length:150 start_codon:yes stop_codon:yes gene_type:complete
MKLLNEIVAILYVSVIILPSALFAAMLAFYEVCKVLPNEVFQRLDDQND